MWNMTQRVKCVPTSRRSASQFLPLLSYTQGKPNIFTLYSLGMVVEFHCLAATYIAHYLSSRVFAFSIIIVESHCGHFQSPVSMWMSRSGNNFAKQWNNEIMDWAIVVNIETSSTRAPHHSSLIVISSQFRCPVDMELSIPSARVVKRLD